MGIKNYYSLFIYKKEKLKVLFLAKNGNVGIIVYLMFRAIGVSS